MMGRSILLNGTFVWFEAVLVLGGVAALISGGAEADEPNMVLGAYLAQGCASCHGTGTAIPTIVGRPEAELVDALLAYRNGNRIHDGMQTIARTLSDDDLAAVSAWLARGKR